MRISDWSSDVCSSDLDHGAVLRWASNPTVALALILLVASVFWHLRIGLQVMIEDYVHGQAARLFALVLLNFYAIGGGAYGMFAIDGISFSGGAAARAEGRRIGKEWVSMCRSGWVPLIETIR